jgi:hypothetical protein
VLFDLSVNKSYTCWSESLSLKQHCSWSVSFSFHVMKFGVGGSVCTSVTLEFGMRQHDKVSQLLQTVFRHPAEYSINLSVLDRNAERLVAASSWCDVHHI